MAERDAAIHASRALVAEFSLVHVEMKLGPVVEAVEGGAIERGLPHIFKESGWLAHDGVWW
jgi:hypothetical protein